MNCLHAGSPILTLNIKDPKVRLQIQPQLTKVFLDDKEEILTVRFQLNMDISLTKWNDDIDRQIQRWTGPANIDQLSCKSCSTVFLNQEMLDYTTDEK